MFLQHSISSIHRMILEGKLDPLDVAMQFSEKMRLLEPKYFAWVRYDDDAVMRAAELLRSAVRDGRPIRPLEGMPVGVKDVFNTADFPTEMGSDTWRGFTPGNDARVVHHLRKNGAVVAGKTVTAEFAVHALNATLNPHNPARTPGTSSSGSAVAVALGMVPVALGTQTAGSIIRPASFCGVYGFKPSFGLIPRTGSLKTTDSLDTIGYFVARAEDLRPTLHSLRVHGPNYPFVNAALSDPSRQEKPQSRPWRVAVVTTSVSHGAPEYATSALSKFIGVLAGCKDVELTELVLPDQFNRCHEIHRIIYDKSLAYYFEEEAQHTTKVSSIMLEMIRRGDSISNSDFREALGEQSRLASDADDILRSFDVCLTLSTAGEAPLRGVEETPDTCLMWTLLHLPAINVPAFTSASGMPFGLQVFSRRYNDLLLLSFIDYLLSEHMIPEGPTRIAGS